MNRVGGIIISLFFILLFTQCGEKYATFAEFTVTPGNKAMGGDTLLTDSIGGFRFSRLTKPGNSGLSCTSDIDPKYRNKQLCIVFAGRVRSNFAQSVGSISLSGNGDDDYHCLTWRAIPLKYHVTEMNKWCPFRDSIILPPLIEGKPLRSVTVMVFMGGVEGEKLDVDTLRAWYKVKKR